MWDVAGSAWTLFALFLIAENVMDRHSQRSVSSEIVPNARFSGRCVFCKDSCTSKAEQTPRGPFPGCQAAGTSRLSFGHEDGCRDAGVVCVTFPLPALLRCPSFLSSLECRALCYSLSSGLAVGVSVAG